MLPSVRVVVPGQIVSSSVSPGPLCSGSITPAVSGWATVWMGLKNPVAVFVFLSVLFGLPALVLNPPLRGPDEAAHFLRAYGSAHGDIVPSTYDQQGRKGVVLPAGLHDDFKFFEARPPGLTYRDAMNEFLRQRNGRKAEHDARPPVFALYEGAESYSPVPYLPYVAAAWISRAAGFDFLGMLYLMRLTGLVAMTAVAAYAIARAPHLKWTFLLIALLPAALYGRTVVSADGASLSFMLVITALCLRSATERGSGRPGERAVWMTLCALCKPPQVAFVVLEAMSRPFRDRPRHWRTVSLIVLPGVVLTVLWVVAVSADAGTWRIVANNEARAELFDPARKFWHLFQEPLHFPRLLVASLAHGYELWRQLIGVLGWLDTPLRDWVYPAVSLFLVAVFAAPLPLNVRIRYQIAAVAAVATLGYVLAVYLIFYLTWTPIDAELIWGVQGRYFVGVLPLVALCVAALLNRGSGETAVSLIAIAGAFLSGCATVEAILRVYW